MLEEFCVYLGLIQFPVGLITLYVGQCMAFRSIPQWGINHSGVRRAVRIGMLIPVVGALLCLIFYRKSRDACRYVVLGVALMVLALFTMLWVIRHLC